MKNNPDSYLLYEYMNKLPFTVRMKACLDEGIDEKILTKAAQEAIGRFPYFAVKVGLDEGQNYTLEHNDKPIAVLPEKNERMILGSSEVNGHLFVITYKDNCIWFNFSHSICGAVGGLFFVKTTLYLYMTEKYGHIDPPKDIKLPGTPGIAIKFLMPSIIRKFDNFGTFILGQFIGFIAAIGIFLSAPNLNIMIIFFMISGVGMGISMPSRWGVLADIIRFTEKKNGVFSAGIANAGISAANKIGAGAASVALGFAMSAAGFNAANGMTQPDTVLRVITFFFIVAPIIGQSIAFITSSIIFNKNCEIRQLIAKDRK